MPQEPDNTKTKPNAPDTSITTKDKTSKTKTWLIYTSLLLLLTAGLFSFAKFFGEESQVEVLTREAVVDKVQSLSRLETVVYSVDTIITAKREGSWQLLWQDAEKGLFVAHGKVVAGVDFAKLNAENVRVISATERTVGTAEKNTSKQAGTSLNPSTNPDAKQGAVSVEIDLPAVEVLSVYLDDIEVYDIRSGLLGLTQTDGALYEQAQTAGKAQVLSAACKAGVLKTANDNAIKQVKALFELANVDVVVTGAALPSCA